MPTTVLVRVASWVRVAIGVLLGTVVQIAVGVSVGVLVGTVVQTGVGVLVGVSVGTTVQTGLGVSVGLPKVWVGVRWGRGPLASALAGPMLKDHPDIGTIADTKTSRPKNASSGNARFRVDVVVYRFIAMLLTRI